MSSGLLVVGSVAFDTIETRAGKRTDILGGAAVYIAMAASHFSPARLVAVVGKDDFPTCHIDALNAKGVDLNGLEYANGRTFRWSGVYADDFSSRETVSTDLGVFATFNPRVPTPYLDSQIVLLGNINPSVQLAVLDQLPPSAFIVTDTMNLWIDTALLDLKRVIARTGMLVVNDEEAVQLTGELQIRQAAGRLLQMGPVAVIIKRGEHGAWLFTNDTMFFVPALPLSHVVDPTGAGDSFAGALCGYMAHHQCTGESTIKKGMVYASAAAATTCEGFGTEKTATVTRREIEDRYDVLRHIVSVD